jgi:hypothetical protein
MKTKHIQLNVGKNNVSFLEDPQQQGHDAFIGYIKVINLPFDNLPLEINPRAQNLNSRVAKQIENGLVEDSEVFHLLNRGLTITALSANYDPKKEILDLEMAGENYGNLDGAHSFAVIRKNVQPFLTPQDGVEAPPYMNAYVPFKILTGIKGELVVDVAAALNTSAQVHEESLANLAGDFDWIKELFKDTKFGKLIAYRENENSNLFPIDIREVIALLTMFHQKFESSDTPPIQSYASKGRCLQLFREDPAGFKKLSNIAIDICELYDFIHFRFAEVYEQIGGLSGSGTEDLRKSKQTKLAKVTGVKKFDEGFDLHYLGRLATYRLSDGWIYPALAAMRGIVGYRGEFARWKMKPQIAFDSLANSIVKATLETSRQLGKSPNAVGKSQTHWIALHEKIINYHLRSISVEKE